jgi:hypothetical protein
VNIHDEMSDSEVLSAASRSLSAVPVASAPNIETIMARTRARRRRRLSAAAGVSVAGAAAGTALALGLTGVLGSRQAPAPIKTASFALTSSSDGTATLTMSPSELLDAAALQSDLAQYGIPAKVTTGSMCTSAPAPAGFSQVVSVQPTGEQTFTPSSGVQPTITIDPSALPAGTELSIGDFLLGSGQQQADFVLIDASSYTCSSIPPDPNGLPAGYGPDDGIGLLYGGPDAAGSTSG